MKSKETTLTPYELTRQSTHLSPTQAKFRLRVAIKPANIGSDQRNAEKVEIEDADYGGFEIDPRCRVVTEPMTPVLTSVGERGARNNERPIFGFDAVWIRLN